MKRFFAPLLLALFFLLPTPATAQSGIQDTPSVPTALRQALLSGDTTAALQLIDQLQSVGGEGTDFWAYLRGVVLEQQGDDQAAADAFQAFARDYPESAWRRKAAFHQADALSRLGNWQAAEAIIEAEVKALRGGERQAALAQVYLERAEELSARREGSASLEPRNLDRALTLYRQALALDLPQGLRAKTLGRVAWCEQEAGRWADAAVSYKTYLEVNSNDEQAQLDLGECLLQNGNKSEARQVLEDLAAATKDSEIEAMAMFMIGRGFGTRAEERRMAVGAFRRYLEAHPRHHKSSAARFNVARLLDHTGDLADSLDAYRDFLVAPKPESQEIAILEKDLSLRRHALMQMASVQTRLGMHQDAAETYGRYVTLYPDGPEWAQAQEGMVSEEYAVGRNALQQKQWDLARTSFAAFAAAHPLDQRSREAAFLLGDINRLEAKDKDREDPERARLLGQSVQHWGRLADKFPGSPVASRALYTSGMVYEFDLQDVESAVEQYRRCDFGDYAYQARMRLAEMTEESLAVHTPRSWRTDEAARLKVDARNLEEVKVQVYALDLETYFRKELQIEGVSSLDLDLIAADLEYTYRFDGYQRYKPLESEIALPVEGPGVWAVAVSTEDQRATTLVVRSDLDVILKASTVDMIVFAEDLRTMEPVPGATVLVAFPRGGADGMPRMVEFVCGEDGVGRLDLAELDLKDSSNPRILVKEERGLAVTWAGTSGLSAPSSLQPLSVLDSDRSVYAPGASISYRAILRDAQEGAWTFTPGKDYLVMWREPGGRVLWQESKTLDAFGTLHGSRTLDEAAPLGTYQIVVMDRDREVARRNIQVQRVELPKMELTLESDRAVYYRGEEIEIAFRAQRFYGAPIAETALTLNTPDGREHRLRTNEDGEVTWTFDTRSMARSGNLVFHATMPSEGASTSHFVLLSATGYYASLSFGKDLPIAGRSLQVDLETSLADGSPAARDMSWELQRRDAFGLYVPVEGQSGQVTTDDQGKSSWSLNPERGGNYRMRAYGEDRFGNPIVTATDVFVSGDDDPQKLRLLSDLRELDAGSMMELEVLNRTAPGLALVTVEGGKILEYHLLEVPAGVSSLKLPVASSWFPNVSVAIAMMDGNQLWQSAHDFKIERGLQISMTATKDIVMPGEEAEITIEVRDQLGNPVEASLSLSAVDAGLLAQYPSGLVNLDQLPAQLAWRGASLQTNSSCSFQYSGVTVQLAEELLAEFELQQAEEKWAEGSDRARQELARRAAAPVATPSSPSTPIAPPSVGSRFQADSDMDSFEPVEESELSSLGYVGVGGGAGGRFGGRGGKAGKRKARLTQEETLGPDSSLAYWSATVQTDGQGQAVVRFEMPQRSTRWILDCRGVSQEGSLGQSSLNLVSRADFFVDLSTPARLLEGDRPGFLATVHNLSGHAGEVELELVVDAGARQVAKHQVQVPANGEVRVMLHLPAALEGTKAEEAELRLLATAFLEGDAESPIELQASLQRRLPMQPWGLPRVDQKSGVLQGAGTLVTLNLPKGHYSPEAILRIDLGNSVDTVLVREAVAGSAAAIGRLSTIGSHLMPQDSTVLGLATELQGRLAVAQHLAQLESKDDRMGDPMALRSLASRDLSILLSLQKNDGGWAWSGSRRESFAESSAAATVALEMARKQGLDVPSAALAKARVYLKQALGQNPNNAEVTAQLLDALSLSGNADFGVANRLHRDRSRLSSAALAHLARALHRLKSTPMADEALTTMLARRQSGEESWNGKGGAGRYRADVAMDALALLAVIEVRPQDSVAATLEKSLWDHRPWPQGGPHGKALVALAAARQGQADARNVNVMISINGGEEQEYSLDAGRQLHLSTPLLNATTAQVRMSVQGQGAPAYRVSLEGFDNNPQRQDNGGLSLYPFHMLAPEPMYDGRAIRTGFGVTKGLEGWRNTVTSLDYGGVATLEIYYRTDRGLGREVNQDFLVLEVPLPAGAQVVESGLQGDYFDYQVHDGVAVFTLGRPPRSGTMRIPLRGLVPGEYRLLPPVLADAYDPSHAAIGEAMNLTVLDPGVARSDEYRATPDELYYTGIAAFDRADYDTAWTMLRALEEMTTGTLRVDQLRESTRRLLTMALAREDATAAVNAFEVIKERFSDVIIGFDEITEVADSYRELAEFERAARIYLAIASETFGKDLKVVGVLEHLQDFHESGELMLRLWKEYPDYPAVVETGLTLADRLLQKAPSAHQDASLRDARRDRAVLLFESVQQLNHFLTLYPQNPLAGDAALNLVSAYLALEDYETAATLGAEMAERFPEPRFADAFTYTQAVAEWYQGNDAKAETLLQRIANAEYPREDGGINVSENRDLAWYILAQIHHARRDFNGAAEYYDRVDRVFADAAQVLSGFRRRALAVDEITEVRPGETAMVPLHFRNLEEVELLVYPVDLMTLYLRERSLSGITEVNLAGIHPLVERTVTLEDDGSMRTQDVEVALDLPESGAYLVICRANSLHASGMVLVSDMELEVAAAPAQGSVRVQAIDRGDGSYLGDVDIRVIGDHDGRLVRGRTDRRGLFSSHDVHGAATVIARFGPRDYAFYRGSPSIQVAFASDLLPVQSAGMEMLGSEAYFDNVLRFNDVQQESRAKNLHDQQQGTYLGVSVDKVK